MPLSSPVRQAAVITHGKTETIGDGFQRLLALAERMGVKLLFPEEEREKHGLPAGADDVHQADLVIALGGDGTMLRTLDRFLESGIPVFGVNYGRVGFLTSVPGNELERGVERAFAGEYELIELPTLKVEIGDYRRSAINDVVMVAAAHGRIVELDWQVGGEDFGCIACDGIVCSTAVGSTAYNLSNGGPVLVWGLDVMAVTFVAPHALGTRPLVVPPKQSLAVRNDSADVSLSVLVDGHPFERMGMGERAEVSCGGERGKLALLPEVTFLRRFREVFAS
jgi:NAD+ kinase